MSRDLAIGAVAAGFVHASLFVVLPAGWTAPALFSKSAQRIEIELAAAPVEQAKPAEHVEPAEYAEPAEHVEPAEHAERAAPIAEPLLRLRADGATGVAAPLPPTSIPVPHVVDDATVTRLPALAVGIAHEQPSDAPADRAATSTTGAPLPEPPRVPPPTIDPADRSAEPFLGLAETALPPLLLRNDLPVYPSLARRRGWEGEVLLRIHVSIGGEPGAVLVQRSSGHRVLDDAAVAAARRWRFSPAIRAGEPTAHWVEIPVQFGILR